MLMDFNVEIVRKNQTEIQFVGYEKILDDVRKLSDAMKEQQVSEDNIQESKKLLTAVRKEIKKLDQERLAVKREVLTPYEVLNEKINVLKSVLAEGEGAINEQIKSINAKQQEERKENIKTLFDKYQKSYNAPLWLTFDKFIGKNPTLITNKATSDKKIRESVVSYFETFKQDYSRLKEEFTDKDERSAILISYSKNGFNMDEAIMDYTTMIAEKERLEKEQARVKQTKVPEIVILTGNDKKEVDKPKEIEYSIIKVKTEDLAKLRELGIEWEVGL